MVTIEIVINATHAAQHFAYYAPAGMHCPAWGDAKFSSLFSS